MKKTLLVLAAAMSIPQFAAAEPAPKPREAPEQVEIPAAVGKVLESKDPEFKAEAPLHERVVASARLTTAEKEVIVGKTLITNGQFLSRVRSNSIARADVLIARTPGRALPASAALREGRTLYYDRGWALDEPRRQALGRIVGAGVPAGKKTWSANAFGVMEAPAARLGPLAPGLQAGAPRPQADEVPIRGRWEGNSYRTDNFSVAAGPDRAYAQRIAEEAERHRRRMSVEWLGKAAPPAGDNPVAITYSLYGPNSRGGGGSTTYTVKDGEITGTKMTIQGDRESLLKNILPHEVLHTVLAGKLGAGIPRWADEGAASTAESPEEQRKKYLTPLNNSLARSRQFGLEEMFNMTEYPTDVNRTWEFYGQSNSLAHFLIEQGGGGAKGKQTLVHFLAEGMRTDQWAQALGKHYAAGSVRGLERDWTRWHAGGGTSGAIERSASSSPGTSLPITPLPEPPAPAVNPPPFESRPLPSNAQREAPRAAPSADGGSARSRSPAGAPRTGSIPTPVASRSSGGAVSSGASTGGPSEASSPIPQRVPGGAQNPVASPEPRSPAPVARPTPVAEPRPASPSAGGPSAAPAFNAKRGAVTMTVSLSRGGNAGGSGTIIGSMPVNGRYRNIIVTAGHTFDGYGGAPILVTVMVNGKPVTYKARMVKYSYENRDMKEFELAVLEFESDAELEATKVAKEDAKPGDEVFVVGKSYKEQETTVHATRMSKPNTIGDGTFSRRQSTTEFIPVSGHSGGGLLNAKGELVGVVSGGNGRQGVHTPLEGVHKWLDGMGLSSLYKD